ncbi:MAG TPA: GAF domain-containing protein [Reyranellaceae bacterium]|nr:GAF domain-containing protein [Reyranellaceae bacterium]
MTPFDSCLEALRQGPVDRLFAAVDAALDATVGHKLFTLLYVAPTGLRVKRIYTNMPKEYPVGGYKEVTATPWHELVIQQQKPWVGYNAKDIEWAYFDHELIKSLGCESAMNIPVVYAGRVLGTMNLLDAAGHYKADDPAKVQPYAALMVGPFLDAIAADPDIGPARRS